MGVLIITRALLFWVVIEASVFGKLPNHEPEAEGKVPNEQPTPRYDGAPMDKSHLALRNSRPASCSS